MEFISALVEVFHIDDREQFAAVHLPFVERFVRSHDHDGRGESPKFSRSSRSPSESAEASHWALIDTVGSWPTIMNTRFLALTWASSSNTACTPPSYRLMR